MPASLAPLIEHTQLQAETTPAAVDRLCEEAITHGLFGVCIAPLHVARAARRLAGRDPRVITVIGFPLGASLPAVLALEAQRARDDGAAELDLVIPIGLAVAGELAAVRDTVRTVRAAVPDRPLKVILETGHFSPPALRALAGAVLEAEPDFLKTSTGFGPRGASVADLELLAACAGGRVGLKASGGIRTVAEARALVAAGATRLGTSRGVALVTEEAATADPSR